MDLHVIRNTNLPKLEKKRNFINITEKQFLFPYYFAQL